MSTKRVPAPPSPSLFVASGRLPRFVWVAALLVGLVAIGGAAYAGAALYPDYSQPTGARAEAAIIRSAGVPEGADEKLVGDVLIERFEARDPSTGKLYVADMVKGRVAQVVETERADGTINYAVLLERHQLDAAKLKTLVQRAAPPMPEASYLGLQLQGGTSDVFQVNYSGRLAQEHAPFRGPKDEDLPDFLAKFPTSDIGPALRVFTHKENNFLLNSTRNYPYVTFLFGLKDAVFITSLLFVDATSGGSSDIFVATPVPAPR